MAQPLLFSPFHPQVHDLRLWDRMGLHVDMSVINI